ncbi:MAG: hypothetical protein J3K34DRAFT_525436 [Monoraphidium minutum]|nr:MAG: hypothetical protein J3K34DRAFT_525436 [Monoraphidium minutum]
MDIAARPSRVQAARGAAAALLLAALLLAPPPAAAEFTPVVLAQYIVTCPAGQCPENLIGDYRITTWQSATFDQMEPTIATASNVFWEESGQVAKNVYDGWKDTAPRSNIIYGDDTTTPYVYATAEICNGCGGGGFSGHAYEFCGAALGAQCHGRAFNLLSEARHQFNAEVNRHHGVGERDAFPAAGSWLTAFGLRYGHSFRIALRMRTDVDYTLVQEWNKTRALHPSASAAGGAGPFRELLQSVRVNGADAMPKVGSGETQEFEGGVSVHWPETRHMGDAQDGPVAVITTPDMTWTWYIESEDTWHLDFRVTFKEGARLGRVHGLLGQSMYWAPAAPAAVEGGDDMLYALADGLLGTAFKFNAFSALKYSRASDSRALRAEGGAARRTAGTPAAVALGVY